ncbi:hypothetical protein WICMUC_002092 [Wickerhamomyces mucosus]|uniref:Uncharacterized protein n=1 Tax=Wickerhamomyces mucosus TaxID=1378264 RepID=A0A9P8TFC2_9ASCO|nr:hypothetical protein WICMUC_002092 [Wickerhamomyces mucosus]
MNQNQQVPYSGISSRGYEIAQSSSGSTEIQDLPKRVSSLSLNDDIQSSITQLEPTTSHMTPGLEIYSSLTGGNHINSVIGTGIQPTYISSLFDKFGSGQSTSQTLSNRITRVIKSQRKLMKQKQELCKEINSWCNILPNDESKKLMFHYIKVLEAELDVEESFVKKQQIINNQLFSVTKREKRSNDLKVKRNKMLVKLRDNENKIGDSPITTLTKENLEELECSVDVVEDQFTRSINTGLRLSLVDYNLCLEDAGNKYKESSINFLSIFNVSPGLNNKENFNNNNNLQRLIAQNKLNSSIQSRSGVKPSSSQSVSQYVALSPVQIGKLFNSRLKPTNTSINGETRALNLSNKSHIFKNTDIPIEKNTDDIDHEVQKEEELPMTDEAKYLASQPTMLKLSSLEEGAHHISNDPNVVYQQKLQHFQSDFQNLPLQHRSQQSQMHTLQNNDQSFSTMINSYNTPGSLAIRPGSQVSEKGTSLNKVKLKPLNRTLGPLRDNSPLIFPSSSDIAFGLVLGMDCNLVFNNSMGLTTVPAKILAKDPHIRGFKIGEFDNSIFSRNTSYPVKYTMFAGTDINSVKDSPLHNVRTPSWLYMLSMVFHVPFVLL